MTSTVLNTLIEKNSKVLKIVWLALFLAMILYTIFSLTFKFNNQTTPSNFLIYILHAAGILFAFISIALYKRTFSENQLRKKLKNSVNIDDLSRDLRTNEIDIQKKEVLEQLPFLEQKIYGISNSFMVPYVICWAMNESIVLIGFVSSYLFKDILKVVPFAFVGIILHIQMYPKLKTILEKVRSMPESKL